MRGGGPTGKGTTRRRPREGLSGTVYELGGRRACSMAAALNLRVATTPFLTYAQTKPDITHGHTWSEYYRHV